MLVLSPVLLNLLMGKTRAPPSAVETGPTVDLGYGLWNATVNV